MPVDLSSALPLVWSPSGPVLTNLATNPSFETPKVAPVEEIRRNYVMTRAGAGAVGFWSTNAGGTVVTDDPTNSRPGSSSPGCIRVEVTGPDVAFSTQLWDGSTTPMVPVVAGDTVTWSAWVKRSDGGSMQAQLRWRDGALAQVGQSDGAGLAVGDWERISVTGVAPVGALWAHLSLPTSGAVATGQFVYVDDALAEKTTALLPYFDGSTPPSFRYNLFPDPGATATTFFSIRGGGGSTPDNSLTVVPVIPPVGAVIPPNFTAVRVEALTDANPSNGSELGTNNGTAPIALKAGDLVTFSCWLRSSVDRPGDLRVRHSGGTTVVNVDVTPTPEWARYSITFTAPVDAPNYQFQYIQDNDTTPPWVIGEWVEMTAVLVEKAGTVEPYFSGDVGTPPYVGAWDGAPNASPSRLIDDDFATGWVGTPDASESTLSGVAPVNTSQANLARPMHAKGWSKSGAFSTRLVPFGAQNTEGWVLLGGDPGGTLTGQGITFEPGKTYTALVTLRVFWPSVGTNPNQRFIQFSANNVPGWTGMQSWATPASPNVPGEYEHRLTFTVPADAVNAGLRFASGSGDGNDIWLDDFLLVEGAYTGPYFDGNTVDDNGPGFFHDWTGDENASTSTATELVSGPANPGDFINLATPPRERFDLEGNRLSTFLFELLNTDDQPQGVLTAVMDTSATLTWDVDGKIKGGGSIEVGDLSRVAGEGGVIDWLRTRLRVTRIVNGLAWQRGIWIPTLPTAKWDSDHRYWTIELHDKLVVLDQDAIAEGFVVPEGSNVIDTVRAIIVSTGEEPGAITDSDTVTNNELFFEAGTTKLTIINALLDGNGYYTLRMGNDGNYITTPYVVPAKRVPVYNFVDGETAIYTDQFEVAQDIFFIPNRVVAIQQGDDTTEGMVGIAENLDPESPFSFPNVGRWIVDVQTGVEAFDQEAIDTYAQSRLVDLSNPSGTIAIQVAPIPLNIYDAVTFSSTPAGIEGKFIVDRIGEDLTATGLMKVTIRKIVDITVEEVA